jgi:hypothetical protein
MPDKTIVLLPDLKNQQRPGLPGLIQALIRPCRNPILY